jgi:hypothetical protein
MTAFTTTALFSEVIDGGAITCDLPTGWKDVSEIRQVPDHQEVYIGPGSDEPCFVVEILERQGSVPDEEAARFFFDDLAAANGSKESSFSVQTVASELNMHSGIGMQRFAKGRDYDVDGNVRPHQEVVDVQIELCVVRLAQVETDLLLTLSRNKPKADLKLSEEFRRILSTIKILDWDLFGS